MLLTLSNNRVRACGCFHTLTFLYLHNQYIFLLLDVPNLKLRIIIIIIIVLPTNQPKLILLAACSMKNEAAFPFLQLGHLD